jgi:sugar phosphate isomerase/epimerase
MGAESWVMSMKMGPALSTMWAQQDRFAADFASFAAAARGAGYAAIEVSHSTDERGLDALLRQSVLPVRSLHAPTPKMPSRSGQSNSRLNLAALDETDRCEAVEHHLRTIRYAGEHGIRYMVVHLGGMSRMLSEENRLRRLHDTGRMDSDEAREQQRQAHLSRAAAIGPHLEAVRRSLDELVSEAARANVIIGLENRLHFHEIPNAHETLALLAEYSAENAGYWHDTGHAEVQARLGLIDAAAAIASLKHRIVGMHLHDVRGIRDHRAPGNGDVDWTYIAEAIPDSAWITLEIDQHEPEPMLGEALSFLRERGVIPGA